MAIARDAQHDWSEPAGTATTESITVTGSDPVLFWVGRNNTANNSDALTSVTYNGVTMNTAEYKERTGGSALNNGTWAYVKALLGPSTGTNTLQMNSSPSTAYVCSAVSYTGVLQSGFDNTASFNGRGSTGSTSVTVNDTSGNAWVVTGASNADASWSPGTGANTVSTNGADRFYDSNGGLASGSQSMDISNAAITRNWIKFMISMSEAGGGGGVTPTYRVNNLPILGVG